MDQKKIEQVIEQVLEKQRKEYQRYLNGLMEKRNLILKPILDQLLVIRDNWRLEKESNAFRKQVKR